MKMKRILLSALLLLAFAGLMPSSAQQKSPDKKIVGTWVLVYMQYEGEPKVVCGKDYSQVKYYGPTGEYACAEVVMPQKGKYSILPHEYGTYTYNNGKYTEMGRKGIFIIKGNTAYGKWYNRHDEWKKVSLPDKLTKEIIYRCKAHKALSPDLQQLVHRYILNK